MSQSAKMGLMVIILFYAIFSILMVELYRERHLHFWEMLLFLGLLIASATVQSMLLSAKLAYHD